MCAPCMAEYRKSWRLKHPEKAAEAKRKHNLKKNYGLTISEYDALFARQGYKCAICDRKPETRTRQGRKLRLAVDHCHETGQIRGLLCADCNRAIGQLGDSAERIEKALAYLSKTTT